MVNHIAIHIAVHVGIFHPDAWLNHEVTEFMLQGEISVKFVFPAYAVEGTEVVLGVVCGIDQGVVSNMISIGVVRI